MTRKRRAQEAVQEFLDLGIAFPEPAPASTRKTQVPKDGYLRQEKLTNPPICLRCIEDYNRGLRKRAANRVSHRAWIPGWTVPQLMCAAHAADFAIEHNLGRSRSRKPGGSTS